MTTIRALLLPFLLVGFTGFMCLLALFSTFLIRRRSIDTWLIQFWGKGMCFLVGIKLRVHGIENIPEGGVLFVFNHQSLLDIPVIHAGIPKDFRFGAKIELYNIPIFAATMRALSVVPIARSNRSEAIQALEQAAQRMKAGESFILAPEGTRQKSPQLGEFKTGPFALAIQARKPVVPIVIKNIYRIMPKKAFLVHRDHWQSEVDVVVLKPINGAEFNFEERDTLKEKVRQAMHEEYNRVYD